MTIVAGVFLLGSLLLLLTGTPTPVDPAWMTVLICGYPLLYLAIWRIFVNKGMTKISSALLITIAMIASIVIHELFAAGEVAFIMAIGGILEDKTVERAKKGIKKLISLTPEQGRVIRDQKEVMVPIDQVQMDDILRILPGEAIPVDGQILTGNTSVDQAIITGESLPADKSVGDSVYCGTINRFGSVDIKATGVGKDSSLQKLIRMVQEAESKKAPMQRIVDKWAAWLVPLALLIAVATYFLTRDITRAVTILVVFCPCALALATPTSIMAAIGQATKHGVIIKSGEALEQMGKVDTIAFDKTGTLTYGQPTVSDIVSFDSRKGEEALLEISASVESHSEHPLGKAIVSHAQKRGISTSQISDFQMIPGRGVSGILQGETIFCGNQTFMTENHIALRAESIQELKSLQDQGKAIILVAEGAICIGCIALSDIVRPSAREMVADLEKLNTEVILLTGDNQQAATYLSEQVGIKNVFSELLPAGKVDAISNLQEQGKKICMIGDGVNDAPALKTAQIGIAMGSMGSDIAVEAADIALMGDDISKIPYLKKLSAATIRLIMLNISLSMIINFIAIILSINGILNPITGALVHNIGSVLIVLNAARLYDRKF